MKSEGRTVMGPRKIKMYKEAGPGEIDRHRDADGLR